VTTTGGIANISSTTVANGGYAYFPAQVVSQYPGSSVNFSVTQTATAGGAGITVFVDWNNDLDFADAGETVYTSNAYQATGTTTSSFTIPTGTPIGDYRMRIVTNWNSSNPASCSAGTRGEMEDYKLSVVAQTPCSGTPSPGNTLTSSASVASGANFTLSLQNATSGTGVTYQWQHSIDAGTTWSDVAGATSSTLVTSQTAVKSYRCIVTCSGATGTSNPVAVGLTYCTPTSNCSMGDVIASVVLNTLSNTTGSACQTTAPTGYTNYTGNSALTTTLLPSSSYRDSFNLKLSIIPFNKSLTNIVFFKALYISFPFSLSLT
jgi:hypothetical protein